MTKSAFAWPRPAPLGDRYPRFLALAGVALVAAFAPPVCLANGWTETWERFIASPQPNSIDFLKLRAALQGCRHHPAACPDSLEPESDQLGDLFSLVAQGDVPTTELMMLSLKVLDEDMREDTDEMLGQYFEQHPGVFLSFSKQYAFSSRALADILCDSGAEAVDDVAKQAVVLERRRALLGQVSYPGLQQVAHRALGSVNTCLRRLKLPPDR